jgi:hypothetical protein
MQLPQQMPEALRQNAAVQLVVTVYTAWQRFSEQARDAVMKWIPNPENIDVQVRKAQFTSHVCSIVASRLHAKNAAAELPFMDHCCTIYSVHPRAARRDERHSGAEAT